MCGFYIIRLFLVVVAYSGCVLSRRPNISGSNRPSLLDVNFKPNHNYINSADNCMDANCTLYEVIENPIKTTRANDFIWCPINYNLYISVDGVSRFRLCQPKPCLPKLYFPEQVLALSRNDSHLEACAETRDFNHFYSSDCARTKLKRSEYEIDNGGNLLDKVNNRSLLLGNYFIQFEDAILCTNSTEKPFERIAFSCSPFHIPSGGYAIAQNGSLIVQVNSVEIFSGFFKLDSNDNSAHVCFPNSYEFETCKSLTDITLDDQVKLMDNFTLFTNNTKVELHSVGNYFITENETMAVVCAKVKIVDAPLETKDYVYGAAAIISAIFAFLTLVIHIVCPNINLHAKSLLCHIISLFIMFVTIAIRNFIVFIPYYTLEKIVFSCQYIFTLSTFCWLNVLAFELWHAFSKFQRNTAPKIQNGQKLCFYFKCAYAWGLPLFFCLSAAGIATSPTLQAKLHLSLTLSKMVWFNDKATLFILLYGPMFAILMINLFLFGWTIWNIKKISRGSEILKANISRKLLRVYVKLSVVMGLSWFAEILSAFFGNSSNEALFYFTDFINLLQGLAIFIIYVCKRSTIKLIKKKLHGEVSGASHSTKSTSSQERDRRNGASPSFNLRTIPAQSTNSNLSELTNKATSTENVNN